MANNRFRPCSLVAFSACGIAGLIGLVVLAGWTFGVDALKSVLPGFIAMQPWTAVSFILGGMAICLAGSDRPAVRTASSVPAFLLIMVAGVQVIENVIGHDFGIDTVIFPHAVVSAQTHAYAHPGRMSRGLALGMVALGSALLLAPRVKKRAGRMIFSALATVGLAMAACALVRYGLALEAVDTMFLRNPLALHSTLGVAALSVGTLALRPDAGWVKFAAEQGFAGWVAAVVLGLAGILLVFGADSAMLTGANTAGSMRVSAALESLLSAVKDAESAQRAYLLTGRSPYLEPFDSARHRMPGQFEAAHAALAGASAPPGALTHLRSLVADKMAELSETIELQHDGRHADALARLDADQDKTAIDAIQQEVTLLERATGEREALQAARGGRIAASEAVGNMLLGAFAWWALMAAVRGRRQAALSLADSQARERDLLATLALGTFMARDPDGTIRYWADGCARLFGWTAEEAIGQSAHRLLATRFPVPLTEIEAALLQTGAWTGDLQHRTRDGRLIVVTAHKMMRRGGQGKADLVLESVTDVTAQRRAEADLRDSQALLNTVIETTPGLIYAKDRLGRVLLANSALAALAGKPLAGLTGLTARDFIDDPQQSDLVMANDLRIIETGRPEEVEEPVTDPNGRTLVWLSTKTPMRDSSGAVTGLVGVSLDITQRKVMEERLRLMVNELNHRVKNMLSTVQSIAWQTLRRVDPAAFHTLEGRLHALAAVHDVVTEEGWTEADLREVIEGVLAPYGGSAGGRFVVSGPATRVQPRVAVALSMALHELATNAVKYGALACSGGRVVVRWTITADSEPRLELIWSEQGGPAVTEPEVRGFGTRLIERGLAFDIGGTARISFETSGVICVIEAPLGLVVAPARVVPFPRVGRAAMRG